MLLWPLAIPGAAHVGAYYRAVIFGFGGQRDCFVLSYCIVFKFKIFRIQISQLYLETCSTGRQRRFAVSKQQYICSQQWVCKTSQYSKIFPTMRLHILPKELLHLTHCYHIQCCDHQRHHHTWYLSQCHMHHISNFSAWFFMFFGEIYLSLVCVFGVKFLSWRWCRCQKMTNIRYAQRHS